jgi:hypothetical protein
MIRQFNHVTGADAPNENARPVVVASTVATIKISNSYRLLLPIGKANPVRLVNVVGIV